MERTHYCCISGLQLLGSNVTGPNVTGSKCYRVQMLQGLALMGDNIGVLPSLFCGTDKKCTSWEETSSREIKSNRLGGGNTGERESDKG